MQAMSFFGGTELAVLLMFFGGAGLPLGVPPEKENPVMAHVAPDDCLLYASWAGMATPDPASGNQTEQLFAEAEVRQFAAAFEKALAAGIGRSAGGREDDPRAALLAKSGPLWIRSLLTRPAAIYLTRLEPKGNSFTAEGGLIVQAGESAAMLDETLTQLLTTDEQKPAEVAIATRKFHKLAASPDFPVEITWGAGNGYLMVGLGEGAIEAMSARIRAQQSPAWLTQLVQAAGIERRSSVSYANVKKALDTFAPLAGPQADALLAALGQKQITTLGSVTGMDETGMVSKTLLSIDGPARGLLAALDSEGIAAGDLAHVPADALVAANVSFEAVKVLEAVLAAAAEVDPRGAAELNDVIRRMEADLGFNLNETLAALGNNWSLHAATADGGLMCTAVTVEVKDRAKLLVASDRLLARVQREGAVSFASSSFAGHTIYQAMLPRSPMPFAPSWCLTDKQLIIGLFPQAVKAVLARKAGEKSLGDAPEVVAALAGGKPPLAISFSDTKALFEATYPSVQMLAPMMLRELARPSYNRSGDLADLPPLLFEPGILPTPRSISRHLRPSVTVVRRTAAGLEIQTRQTLPVMNVGASAPVAVALLLPAVQASRAAAGQMQSQNNLKQQLLALHNFHDIYKRFPAGYSAGEDGKPLLSWRVHILPLVEQQPLYNEFHLDEPWDSEHNKKLIARMPDVFKVPGSKAGPGMTSYLGVGGKSGVLIKPTGKGKTSFTDGTSLHAVLDGTSNTLAIVEANDEAAVIWTRPEEWVPDPTEPLKPLLGRRPNGFLAALCDGSVRMIPKTVTAQNLLWMFDRADGNAIDWSDIRPGRAAPAPPVRLRLPMR
jgi:hypothetical protein